MANTIDNRYLLQVNMFQWDIHSNYQHWKHNFLHRTRDKTIGLSTADNSHLRTSNTMYNQYQLMLNMFHSYTHCNFRMCQHNFLHRTADKMIGPLTADNNQLHNRCMRFVRSSLDMC